MGNKYDKILDEYREDDETGSGTVTSFVFTNGSGFIGSVLTATTTPTLSLTLQTASASQSGQLSSTDWSTFNNKVTSVSVITNQGVSGTVSVTSAITLSLGAITPTSVAVSGTAGAGFLSLISQSSNPSSPAAGTINIFSNTQNGFTRITHQNEATTPIVIGRDNIFIGKNTSGSSIPRGSAVYISGSTGVVPNFSLAQANSTTTMVAVAVTVDTVANNAFGQVMIIGLIDNFDTSAFSTGDVLYLSTSVAGGFQNTRPTYPNFSKIIGTVLVSGVGNGSIEVSVAPFIGGLETSTNSATFNMNGNTLRLAGNLTTSGAFATTLTTTGATTLTLPTTGTLATLAGVETLTNKDLTGVGNTFPTFNQDTTGSAATLTTTRTLWGQNFNGSANVTGSLTSVGNITGGASSMTIQAGTGVGRTLTFKTTDTGSAAQTVLTLGSDKSTTFAAGIGITLGSDATGDIFYRNSSGVFARLGLGATGTVLQGSSTVPSWSGAAVDGEGLQLNNTGFVSAPLRTTPQGRLTLTTAVPITTTDVTAATTIYYTPYHGDVIPLYDGTRWKLQTFTEKSIVTTDTQSTNATYNNGSATLSNLTDTSQLMRGMTISSNKTGIGALTISTIDSATQVTMSGNASVSQTGATITFTIPASRIHDVFYVQSSGKIQFSNNWVAGARVDAISMQNGIYVNTSAINSGDSNSIAAKTGTYLGTIRTTTTAGQTEDSLANRFIWNNYNRVQRPFFVNEPTDSWTYTTATWRQANGNTANRVQIVCGLSEDSIFVKAQTFANNSSSVGFMISIGENSTTAFDTNAQVARGNSTVSIPMIATLNTIPNIGYSNYNWIEFSTATGTTTWFGDGGVPTSNASGMSGMWPA